jgi:hypothetical protein
MKLFVWANPYHVVYGSSPVFAVAETEEMAHKECQMAPGYEYGDCDGSPPRLTPLGEPTRVVDLPCAEWHEWSD